MEQWKAIEGYEHYYEVSDQGNIHTIGGFEKFAEWGLLRPLAQV